MARPAVAAPPRRLPRHARRRLEPGESVLRVARPRAIALRMLAFFGSVIAALAVVAFLIEDPGFMSLASLPAFPLLGGLVAHFVIGETIVLTDRRVLLARRFEAPLAIDLGQLRAIRREDRGLARRLGYGRVLLIAPLPGGGREGVFMALELDRLPDAGSLASAIATAATAAGGTPTLNDLAALPAQRQ